jgi:ubiquinol-cytochrome c reductase subunit 6
MGFFSSFTDLIDAATPWSTAEAEAPTRGGASETSTPATKDDDKDQGEAAVSIHFLLKDWEGMEAEDKGDWSGIGDRAGSRTWH